MNYISRTLLLSILFVSAVKADYRFLNNQEMAIGQRIYFKKCLNQGKIIGSSLVIKISEDAYWLKGNGYLPDEVYYVSQSQNTTETNPAAPQSWIKQQLDKGIMLPLSIALQLDKNIFWIYESNELYTVSSK